MTTLLDPQATSRPTPVPQRSWRPTPERASLIILLALTGLAYLWTLSESGFANQYYSAAAQAGGESWEAWVFGALDASGSITVDKPPASLWVMGLSVRIFGLSSWSILAPQALMGVGTVWLVFAMVKKVAPWQAAIVAGALTALTPAAALMFRFNNPDALLLLLLVGAGFSTLKAIETGRGRWMVLAGVLLGFGFLTKMLQAFLIVPAIAVVYLVTGKGSFGRRLTHGVACVAAMVASAGWYVAIVEFLPESARPYIDGSTGNSLLELTLGYNGVGRLNGGDFGGLGNAGFSSAAGILRLFQGVSGGMVSWLLPAALLALVAGLVALRKAPRTDLTRAALMLSGATMLVTGLVFSFMAGIYHDYYVVALAPWIAITAVVGTVILWRDRDNLVSRITLAVAMAGSGVWGWVLLGQSGEQPYDALRWPVLIIALGVAAGFVFADRLTRRAAVTVLAAAAVAVGVGPAAYAIQTIGTAHTGSIVTAGPYQSGGMGGPGGGRVAQMGGPGGRNGTPPAGQMLGTQVPGPQTDGQTDGQTRQMPRRGNGGMPAGGAGGPMGGGQVDAELAAAVSTNAAKYTWVAAAIGSQTAAGLQLETEEPVMAIGGFNGTSNSITLEQFQQYVADGEIHYFISGGGMGGRGGSSDETSSASEIRAWVEENFTQTTIGDATVYDLTEGAS
ncbi:glycosyltransferase family 39 protein [Nocardioides sp.]|uniref:ArnT family glycosyltransferase n=1 Tax=Nocardioides sp. TaxID=35761 RepID=UPI00198EEA95|nr:glycosyltransferase family 39 protein [Nocardioides sp.]MBC7276296.1 glycosyltransferase family 39 protein [Nocardioides sp.]